MFADLCADVEGVVRETAVTGIVFDHLPVPGGTWTCGCSYDVHASLDDTWSALQADECRRKQWGLGGQDEHASDQRETRRETEAGRGAQCRLPGIAFGRAAQAEPEEED